MGNTGGAIILWTSTSEISNSSFVSNKTRYDKGGAIFVGHGVTLNVINSTFNANKASLGGAIATNVSTMRGIIPSRTTLTHVTIVPSRVAGKGLGFNLWVDPADVNFKLRNSILVGTKGPYRKEGSSCQGPLSENIGNFIEDGSCASMVGGDPMLAETTGSPAHFPLLDGSPAGFGHDVITLTEDIVLNAPLPSITSEITIEGNGYTISGSDEFRIFDVDGGRLTISDMTLRDGDATQGGAIRLINGARVTAANVAFSDNLAGHGGAIATESADVRLDVSSSSFIGNQGDSGAGAVLVDGGTVNISASAFLGNRAGSIGGAMETRSGTVDLANSTFSDNLARQGGAIFSHGADTTLTHVTLMNNRAHNIVGAGIYHHSGTLNLRNSIVAGSGRGDDCYGRLTENRGNLSQDGTCSTAIIADPLLAERTGAHYPLLNASPAHAAADPAFCLPTDQLGNPRPHCDIGAIESERAASEQPPPARVIPADCSLADQIIAANTDAPAGSCPAGQGADIITLREDIKLSETLPTISSDLTIRGNGHTIDGDNRFRIFDIEHGEVNIKNVTLINGSSPGEYGGAIRARGDADVVVARVAFRNNSAGWGGGIASVDSARVNAPYSSFFNNAAEHKGGGLWFNSSECYAYANPMFDGNSSGTHVPDPQYEIFTPHVEFGPGVRSRCETRQ